MALYEKNVPVHYLGGPLSGEVNDQDYGFYEELEPGWVFDYPTRSWTGGHPVGLADTVERYVLERREWGWVFVHTGTFEQPIEDTAFFITLVGGARTASAHTCSGAPASGRAGRFRCSRVVCCAMSATIQPGAGRRTMPECDECRSVTLASGETIPVLGGRELSPAGVAALGELVEAVRRAAAQNPPDPDAAELWARIDTARRAAGLSLREVSALTGVRFAVLFRTAQGRMPDAGELAAVEAWLAVRER